jgi:nucleoside-diphosphate-sugar epimerase
MWRRWRHEFEQTRRESDKRHDEWRAEHAAFLAEQKRRFDAIDAAMENDKRVTREMVIELRERTALITDVRHGIQANTEGLLRVLDEMRRNDGPSPAGA